MEESAEGVNETKESIVYLPESELMGNALDSMVSLAMASEVVSEIIGERFEAELSY